MITRKKEIKKDRDLNRCGEAIDKYRKANKEAKKPVAKAKKVGFRHLYSTLEEKDGLRKAIRIVKQRNRVSGCAPTKAGER